jgi:hypothetical protein
VNGEFKLDMLEDLLSMFNKVRALRVLVCVHF